MVPIAVTVIAAVAFGRWFSEARFPARANELSEDMWEEIVEEEDIGETIVSADQGDRSMQ